METKNHKSRNPGISQNYWAEQAFRESLPKWTTPKDRRIKRGVFCLRGLDTETQNGTCVLIATPYRYAEPGSFEATLRFLSEERKYVCWNADFDIQAIIKFLPFPIKERLYHFGEVWYGGYKIRYRKAKYLSVSVKVVDNRCRRRYRLRNLFQVYDLKQFYQSSLEKTAQLLLNEGKDKIPRTWITQMKARLRDPKTRYKVIRYCMKDALRTEQIARISWDNFARIGLDFSRPVSNAALAVKKFRDQISNMQCPLDINVWARESYRGGKIECSKIGYFPEAYLLDIHSAYPSAMLKLRKLDGTWIECDTTVQHGHTDANQLGPSEDAIYAVVDVTVRIPKGLYLCPVPLVTREFPLIYPHGEWKTTVDLTTFRALAARGWIVTVHAGKQMIGGSNTLMFPEMTAMYDERIANPLNSWAIKIVMNSLYGKFAQVMKRYFRTRIIGPETEIIGRHYYRCKEVFPKFTNFVLAAAITADIRQRIYNEVPHKDLIFASTDGVMLTRPSMPERLCGAGLGQWETAERVRDLVVIGSGIYSYVTLDKKTGEDKRVTKMRGFNVDLDLVSALDTVKSTVRFRVNRNITLAQTVRAGTSRDMNEIVEVPRDLDLNFDVKRIWDRARTGRMILHKQIDSQPYEYFGKAKVIL